MAEEAPQHITALLRQLIARGHKEMPAGSVQKPGWSQFFLALIPAPCDGDNAYVAGKPVTGL